MLFDRSNRRLTLTSEGLLLRRRAEEILELVGKTEQEIAARAEMVAGTVSLGCGDLAAVKALSELIRGFIRPLILSSTPLRLTTSKSGWITGSPILACCWNPSTKTVMTIFICPNQRNG